MKIWVYILVFIGIGLLVISPVLPVQSDSEKECYTIWDAKCPWGVYWTDIEGGGFIIYSMSSSLQESYVLKYMDDGELKTLILPATGETEQEGGAVSGATVHVYLTSQCSGMWFERVYWVHTNIYGGEYEGSTVCYNIYIPDPKVMPDAEG